MSSTPPKYRVVIFDAIDEPKSLRELISKATGAHPADALQWLAKAPGVWPKELDEPSTRTLVDGLYEFGVAAEAWRTDQFPELSPARTIHRAACLDEGLRLDGLRGEPTHWVPWDRIEMICAGRVVHDDGRGGTSTRWPSTVVSGLRAVALRKPRSFNVGGRPQRDPVGEVLVIRREPRIAFRFVENKMNYAYLGDRLQESAADNFPIFLAEPARAIDLHPPDREHPSDAREQRERRPRIPQLAGDPRPRHDSTPLELVPTRPRNPEPGTARKPERPRRRIPLRIVRPQPSWGRPGPPGP